MSKKNAFRSQASSSRASAAAGGFGGFGSTSSASTLSYLSEPADLSSISDPNVVVAFKNMNKKDGTTKTKGLEDLREYIQDHPFEKDGGAEDAVVEAWVGAYPRLSIDNNKRVRELSHLVLSELISTVRKRIEKHLTKVIGPWLGGLYDRDRSVSSTAESTIKSFATTKEKQTKLKRQCQGSILDYAQAALQETAETLSDERTMTLEDMLEKYHRVISAGLCLIMTLLSSLDLEDIAKQQEKYEELLSNNGAIWDYVSSKDPSVRTSVAQLLIRCVEKKSDIVETDLRLIGRSLLMDGLKASQSTTAISFMQALKAVTLKYPEIWASSYKGKKTPSAMFLSFAEKGPQDCGAMYWKTLSDLVKVCPKETLFPTLDDSDDFLRSLLLGIKKRPFGADHTKAAQTCCIDVLDLLVSYAPPGSSAIKLCETAAYPQFDLWLADKSLSPLGNEAISRVYNICANIKGEDAGSSFADYWKKAADMIVEQMSTSLPQQSKEYKTSQDKVVNVARRWFQFAQEVLEGARDEDCKYILDPCRTMTHQALSVMSSRDGKPYSAAAIVDDATCLAVSVSAANPQPATEHYKTFITGECTSFIKEKFILMTQSPSAEYVVSIFQRLGHVKGEDPIYRSLFEDAISSAVGLQDPITKFNAVSALFTVTRAAGLHSRLQPSRDHYHTDYLSQTARNLPNLQNFFLEQANKALESSNKEILTMLEKALVFEGLSDSTETKLVHLGLEKTSQGPQKEIDTAYVLLDIIFRNKPILFRPKEAKTLLVKQMLRVSEEPSTTPSARLIALNNIVDSLSDGDGQDAVKIREDAIVEAIHTYLDEVNNFSLRVETLVGQANELCLANPEVKSRLFPHIGHWARDLMPLLRLHPNLSLGLMRPFAGAVFLARKDSTVDDLRLLSLDQEELHPVAESPNHDQYGLSRVLRYGIYTLGILLDATDISTGFERDRDDVFRLLSMTRELVSDQIDLRVGHSLFDVHHDAASFHEAQNFVHEYDLFLSNLALSSRGWLLPVEKAQSQPEDLSSTIKKFIDNLISISKASQPAILAYYAARALARLLDALCIDQEWPFAEGEEWLRKLGVMNKSTQDIFTALAVVNGVNSGLFDSQSMKTMCNHLVSDLAAAKYDAPDTYGKLLLLNACLDVYGDFMPAAQNRLVFAMKNIVSWMDKLAKGSDTEGISSEVCRLLQNFLPATKDIYGTQWGSTVEFCIQFWRANVDGRLSEASIPMMGMSLKLYSKLRDLPDACDDLAEALEEYNDEIIDGLLTVLKLQRPGDTLPVKQIDELLWRLLSPLQPRSLSDVSELYPLVASEYPLVQASAYHMLREALVDAQQHISLDVALEKKNATLPDELLSLLLEAPNATEYPDKDDLDEFPTEIRSYLLSWHLVFQSFATASEKVRNDYTVSLKTERLLDHLLMFIAGTLGHIDGGALDLDHAKITESMRTTYSISEATTLPNLQNMQWLLANLYYLALLYTPMLVKNWYTNVKSRAIQQQYSSWTQKFFTDLIVSAAIIDVQKWADGQEITPDEQELIVKCSAKTKDIFASYEIDDMTMSLSIHLPESYPLTPVSVSSINRVGISEQKWKSFMITTQAVISFSNGSIPEGLSTLRRNIIGALKGHTECAICYSIISSDKKTPDKKCSTCSNLFHSKCLYTWFQSSNQSTCPLCRNPFNYASRS